MKDHLLVLGLVLTLSGCVSKIHVNPVKDSILSEKGGVYYALPRTFVVAEVPVTKNSFKPGAYCGCVDKLFPELPVKSAQAACDPTDPPFDVSGASILPRNDADPTSMYQVDVQGGLWEDKVASLVLTENGVLTHAEAESKNSILEFAGSVLSTAGSLAKAAGTRATPKCDDDDLSKAKQVLARIKDAEAKRDIVLTTPTNAGEGDAAAALQVRLKAFEDRITSDLNRYFFGRNKSEVIWTGQFELLPSAAHSEVTLFRFNPDKGICPPSDSTLTPTNPFGGNGDSTDSGISADCNTDVIEIRLKLDVPSQAGNSISVPEVPLNKTGFFYRVPVSARVQIRAYPISERTLKHPGVLLSSETMWVAHMGKTAWLPPSTGGRRTQYTLDLWESNGGIKNFKVASDAMFDKSLVPDVGGAATSVVEARKTAAAQKSDLNKLKDANALLEEQKKQLELQNAIDALKKSAAQTPQDQD
jgi:Domain of unknown function (DUF4831)